MAEVMKFEDFKAEGSESNAKVGFEKILLEFLFSNFKNVSFRLLENTASREETTLLRMEILFSSNLMPVVA